MMATFDARYILAIILQYVHNLFTITLVVQYLHYIEQASIFAYLR